jgi:NADH:ubiquinone oxidoreductase subunit 6 (subunit J)
MSEGILLFWIFGVAILSGAALVAFTRNMIHAAAGLFLSLFAVAGIFILSGADFLGIVQLIVYIGGVLILLLFGVMLTRKTSGDALPPGSFQLPIGIGLTVLLVAAMIYALLPGDYAPIDGQGTLELTEGSTSGIGVQMLTQYVLPFEAVSFLLLTTLVGAAWLARRKAAEPRNLLSSTPPQKTS